MKPTPLAFNSHYDGVEQAERLTLLGCKLSTNLSPKKHSHLLFNFLDERTDASFCQQLNEASYDLDVWLEAELMSTIRSAGLEDGINYVGNGKGLWNLLKYMLKAVPEWRVIVTEALRRFEDIVAAPVSVGTEEPSVLVLMSDRVFEVVDNDEVVRLVWKGRNKGLGGGDVEKSVVEFALGKGTRDNVSVVVVYFD